MIKTLSIGLFALLGLFGFGFAMYTILAPTDTSQKNTIETRIIFPTAPDATLPPGATFTVLAKDESSLAVYDFRRDQSSVTRTTLDTGGDYYTLTTLAEHPDFSIVYFADAQTFNLVLRKIPFPETERRAIATLQKMLRISSEDICRLRVVVAGVERFEEIYASSTLTTCTP